ncbi:hypothetical protein [Streptomyces sp. NPDC005303]
MASRLAEERARAVRLVVVAHRPPAGTARLSPFSVSASALERLLRP